MSRPRLTALSLALIATVAGCGGSSKSSSQTSPSAQTAASTAPVSSTSTASSSPTGQLTRTQLIAAANLICGRVNAKHDATTFRGQGAYARILPEVAALQQEAVASMRKLIPPATMAKGWKQLVTADQNLANSLTKLGEVAQANQLGAERDVVSTAVIAAQDRMFSIAKREGITECARNH